VVLDECAELQQDRRVARLLGGGAERARSQQPHLTYTGLHVCPGRTRRLINEAVNTTGPERSDAYAYDVFGNRARQIPWTSYTGQGCEAGVQDTSYFGTDNELKRRTVTLCNSIHAYLNDKAGNRLVQYDTINTFSQGPQNILSYTAKNQLFFSMSTTAQTAVYDYNWNWYDAAGMRVITQATTYNTWVGGSGGIAGPKTYYVYDGNDVALAVLYNGTSWFVRSRYLTGGLDQPLAGRFASIGSGAQTNLALVTDWQGTSMAALHSDATQESDVSYLARSAYGNFETLIATQGGTNPQAGYTGASTPNAAGGFVYLRNRWYDPKTGRFLTQDPIGLAGGVNLYAYAGDNPLAYSDPFGLTVTVVGEDVRRAIINLLHSSPTFRRIFLALHHASTSRVNLQIRSATMLDLGHMLDMNKKGAMFERPGPWGPNGTITIDTRPGSDQSLGASTSDLMVHEVIHAAGSYSREAKTGVDSKCQYDSDIGHACVTPWTDKIKKESNSSKESESGGNHDH
jgi:RHS repeat-associated protein